MTDTVGATQEDDKQTIPAAGIDDPVEMFDLLTAAIVPRAIAWVSTVGAYGILNLAPFSFFTVVSNSPPMVSLTLELGGNGQTKDTLRNIRDVGDFVVNIATSLLAEPVRSSSREFPSEVDEFEEVGATAAKSITVRSPRVAESPINMECVLRDVLYPGSDALIIGEIVRFHIDRSVLDADGRIQLRSLDPLARMATQFFQVGQLLLG